MDPWLDISVPIRTGMVVYDTDPEVRLERVAEMSNGGVANVSSLACGVHTGTHIDAPVHFIEGAPGIEGVDLTALIGPVLVVDATASDRDLDAAALERLGLPARLDRVIFKTSNSRLWGLDRFSSDFIGLTEDAARWLLARGVRLAGIDYFSIAPPSDPGPTHIALLEAGVVILEGLDLSGVAPGHYDLVCLPLLIPGSDGAPARALLRRR